MSNLSTLRVQWFGPHRPSSRCIETSLLQADCLGLTSRNANIDTRSFGMVAPLQSQSRISTVSQDQCSIVVVVVVVVHTLIAGILPLPAAFAKMPASGGPQTPSGRDQVFTTRTAFHHLRHHALAAPDPAAGRCAWIASLDKPRLLFSLITSAYHL